MKKWREVVSWAAALLGDEWEVAGKGWYTVLMWSSPHWWLQFLYQEETSNGPATVAAFGTAAAQFKFDPPCDLCGELTVAEEMFALHCARGREQLIYRGVTLHQLISVRVLCGSQPLPDLLAGVRRVLDDDDFDVLGDPGRDSGAARARMYWESLYTRLEAADRPAVEELLAQTRFDTLRWFGLSEAQIPDPVFPEPEVSWCR